LSLFPVNDKKGGKEGKRTPHSYKSFILFRGEEGEGGGSSTKRGKEERREENAGLFLLQSDFIQELKAEKKAVIWKRKRKRYL